MVSQGRLDENNFDLMKINLINLTLQYSMDEIR